MNERNRTALMPEDYVEPRCVLCDPPYGQEAPVQSVPILRIREKLDEHLGRNDYAAAERHLLYWLEEARAGGDARGIFTLKNEMMGLYRKLGRREDAFAAVRDALAMIPGLHFEGSVSAATAYVNAATVYDAFGQPENSLPLFEKALVIYEEKLQPADERLGGLYNNMALALAALGRFAEAADSYQKALEVMKQVPGGELEQAITYLNMANAAEDELGLEAAAETVETCLETAERLLNETAHAHDGYYAFVCEKCAPTFDYYGWFAFAGELKKRAEEIYAGA